MCQACHTPFLSFLWKKQLMNWWISRKSTAHPVRFLDLDDPRPLRSLHQNNLPIMHRRTQPVAAWIAWRTARFSRTQSWLKCNCKTYRTTGNRTCFSQFWPQASERVNPTALPSNAWVPDCSISQSQLFSTSLAHASLQWNKPTVLCIRSSWVPTTASCKTDLPPGWICTSISLGAWECMRDTVSVDFLALQYLRSNWPNLQVTNLHLHHTNTRSELVPHTCQLDFWLLLVSPVLASAWSSSSSKSSS